MHITLQQLELWTLIGVPEEERASEQRILVDLTIECDGSAEKTDELKDTVDYEELYKSVRALAQQERKTLEKLAEGIAHEALKVAKVKNVTITLRKFVLPGTKEVSLTITRP